MLEELVAISELDKNTTLLMVYIEEGSKKQEYVIFRGFEFQSEENCSLDVLRIKQNLGNYSESSSLVRFNAENFEILELAYPQGDILYKR